MNQTGRREQLAAAAREVLLERGAVGLRVKDVAERASSPQAASSTIAEAIARGFVGMEDGLGLQVVIGHSGLDAGEAERILLAYGSGMTGVRLEDVPVPEAPVPSPA